ncbi:TetR/AcrR family transcriptional regulator [Streptomyces qinglanensis]|uniref:DNA-binding transcriptional regulator, AcrR family n=1 Tax=Streptomyces qinglanensis TaxID=943816 RepID=A0A1H9WTG2_9ACTN|nr:TetR/AcrR family transcriptional regulator [Streptomyces qinglanensis]SES37081.1 DNA-binding transcriptional regulator, AcrR family [Streptomyces qinglanensis]
MPNTAGDRIQDGAGEIAERVREVVEATGCSQREFARRIVMDPSKLSRSLSGSRRFTVAELARIADAGRVDAGWLLGSGSTEDTAPDTPKTPSTAPAPGGGTRTTAVPAAGRPLQIVRETVRLIAEHGFHAVRVADIAAACDTSTAAIHYHFPGRAELLEAAVRWCMDEDTASRAARISETGATEDAAAELAELLALQTPRTEQQRRQWLVWLDLWAEAARSTAIGRLHVEYYRQWRTTVADVVRRGIAQGVFRTVDPESSALRLTALVDGLASQVLASAAGAEDGTGPDDMHAALLAYVRTELLAPAAG